MTEPVAIAEAIRRNALRTNNPNNVFNVIERYRQRLQKLGHAATTLAEKERILGIYKKKIGEFDWKFVDRAALRAKWSQLKPHAWQKHRSVWVDLYRFAIAEGICDQNEAEMALPPTAAELERITDRHTDAGYKAIYDAAPEWLQIAMELAVSSLQDLSTLVAARRTDPVVGGVWRVTRGKTKAHIEIKVPEGSRLAKAVTRAQTFPVFGTYLIRREPERRKRSRSRDEFTQVLGAFLSHEFTRVRDEAEAYDMPPEKQPTWHGLRSYGSHLYELAGYSTEYIQALMGHESPKMTEHYQDGYGVKYESAEAGL